ncbi:MAG: ATP-binding cassette domain-containing protein [Sulfuricurvum sp.]|uniref:ABC transporter ATP-binding protein n=1 Tax=Sulfuricurvum sp. TaxID=2025608 RepID=UPI002631ACBB|nr:ATP-binding cassette domain-containing protein [Sulfuricurvum sp.]MDD2828877.1 ATP-binding cassette domain-containing protein [Sulfuricurvum sp.]MDD4948540.1 ATP-binding cassette domain-containing protein [Sulfuricurvum sp.]
MKKVVIEGRNIVTSFGNNLIHNGVNCTIYENEIYALLGGSGSGKSTLLREMILLGKPSSGSLSVLGYDLKNLNLQQSQILQRQWGVLFQSGALYSSLTVGENIELLYKEYTDLPPKLIKELVKLKIDLVGLPAHAVHLYPSQLSGGMIKRAALARALALDPKLLFLDEPTSGLDPLSSRQFDALIKELRDLLGLTIVIVTHDLDTIHHIVDRFVLLGEKRVIAEGTLPEVLKINHPIIDYFFQKETHGVQG